MLQKDLYGDCNNNPFLSNESQFIINKYKMIAQKRKILKFSKILLLQDCESLLKDIKCILSDRSFENNKILQISEEIVGLIDLLLKDLSFGKQDIEFEVEKEAKNTLDNFIIPKVLFNK